MDSYFYSIEMLIMDHAARHECLYAVLAAGIIAEHLANEDNQ